MGTSWWHCFSCANVLLVSSRQIISFQNDVSPPGKMPEPHLRPPLFNCRQNFRNHFALRLRAEIAFAVQTDGNIAGFHVTAADDEHGVDFRLLCLLQSSP